MAGTGNLILSEVTRAWKDKRHYGMCQVVLWHFS